MQQIKQNLAKQISEILGTAVSAADFGIPPNSEMGDLALPCFELAKKLQKNPNEIAAQIANEIDFAKSAGPYVNFRFENSYLNQMVLEAKQVKNQKPTKIMIEYSQPNTHKEFHIGHLRNACLGSALVNIYRELGNKVIAATYVNDIGTHVAKCLWNLTKNHENDQLPLDKGQYLGEIYTEAEQRIDANEDLKKEVAEVLRRLEAQEPLIYKIWKKTRDWSIAEFKNIYNLLNIHFDFWYYESKIYKKGKKITEKLLKNNIAQKSEGAVIVDLSEYNLDILLLLKSDGSTLYSTSDLALAQEKAKKKFDQSIYIVDNRQTLYFKQLFKVLELSGHKENLKHVPYEFVTLPESSMSSRKGNVIGFAKFYQQILDQTISQTQEKHQDWSQEQVKKVAQRIALSAIKFWMLKYDNNSVIVFDMKKAMAIEGDTGPYLLYTIARINSIFKKSNIKHQKSNIHIKNKKLVNYSLLAEQSERELILQIALFDEIVEKAAQDYSPAVICTYLLELAHKFNNFYHSCPVINADEDLKVARIVLIQKTKDFLEKGLELLNIEPVQQM